MSCFYVVGIYEDFRLAIFPTHVSPIIAEFHMGKYRRWAYKIEVPYKIILTHPVGIFYFTPNEMFPFMTYNLITPIKLCSDSQVVAISKDKILVESNKFTLCRKIIFESLVYMTDFKFLYRACLSIRNCYN